MSVLEAKNCCSRSHKKERKKLHENLDPKCITDTKRFWGNDETIFFR